MGRKTTGTLFKRGNNYYVRYQLNGKRVDRALRDDGGRPITDPDAAEDARKAMFAALVYKDKAKQRREMATALSTAEDEAKRAEETARERQAREQAERNLSLLLVTHDERLAARCKRIVYMEDGLVQADSTTPMPH